MGGVSLWSVCGRSGFAKRVHALFGPPRRQCGIAAAGSLQGSLPTSPVMFVIDVRGIVALVGVFACRLKSQFFPFVP